MTKASTSVDDQLYVLADGDNVPNVGGYLGQYSVQDFVSDYVDTDVDKLKMKSDEALYLFELGMTNTASSAFDLQDLVIVVTMTKASAPPVGRHHGQLPGSGS